ncbi:MAG TPA: hypothetical protein DDY31_09505, partial [Lachnospiraceae bacterium]|nr:hypothetical protein [Lachnospiraceae bacterium]
MKKWFKHVLFAVMFAATLIPCKTVFADDGWGIYGDNIKWHFYESTGTLQIEGEGAMTDYGQYEEERMPWYSYHENVKKVIIGEGITHVCDAAFSKYSKLTSVKFSDTVESIGRCTFYRTGIKKLIL